MTFRVMRLDSGAADFAARLKRLLAYAEDADEAVELATQGILADVRARGDAAVLEYTRRFDGIEAATIEDLRVPTARIRNALASIPAAQRDALERAATRIRGFHERQAAPSLRYSEPDGTELGWQVTPLDRAGLYVPGGKAAYPSSVLMNAIPARVAGVRDLVMVSPAPGGQMNPLVLAAAAIVVLDLHHDALEPQILDGHAIPHVRRTLRVGHLRRFDVSIRDAQPLDDGIDRAASLGPAMNV